MAQVIKPTDKEPTLYFPSIFLAGSIEMGIAEDWQLELTEKLKDFDVTIYNPRRDNWNSSWEQRESNPEFNHQVNWEMNMLESASIIFMYFSPETKSPISLLELGLHSEDTIIVCCPDGFWKKGIEGYPVAYDGKLLMDVSIENFKLAMFDARVFQIPYQEEVLNYFIWRQQDATRNSISSVAQANFSTKELHGKKTNEMQDTLMVEKGINWNDFTPREKRGSLIRKIERKFVRNVDPIDDGKTYVIPEGNTYTRNVWEADPETPIFSQEKGYLRFLMPQTPDCQLPIL